MKHVPTVAELYGMGRHLAYPVEFRLGARKSDPPVPSVWHITDAGHALLGTVMRDNGMEARLLDERSRPGDLVRREDPPAP